MRPGRQVRLKLLHHPVGRSNRSERTYVSVTTSSPPNVRRESPKFGLPFWGARAPESTFSFDAA